jgi:hypothetical protein
LPEPLAPTTAKKRRFSNRRSMAVTFAPRPKNKSTIQRYEFPHAVVGDFGIGGSP